MTLIIGCITKENAVITGDTQLTVDKGEHKPRKETEIKVGKYGISFMMGILGRWSWFYSDNKIGRGRATYFNEYKTLKGALLDYKRKDKLSVVKKFLTHKKEIDATAIYINKNENGFELDYISTSNENDNIKRIDIHGKTLMFNEPFHKVCPNFVENKIKFLNEKYNLTNSLGDIIFLLNNVLLEVISPADELTISCDDTTKSVGNNTVGGYVTIQLLTDKIYSFDCLFAPYSGDYNVLLDKLTYPFSNSLSQNKNIRYVDNLAMIVKSINSDINSCQDSLKEVLKKQINYIESSKIISTKLLNDLIVFFNEKYDLSIEKLQVIEEKADDELDFFLADFFSENLLTDEEELKYYTKFF